MKTTIHIGRRHIGILRNKLFLWIELNSKSNWKKCQLKVLGRFIKKQNHLLNQIIPASFSKRVPKPLIGCQILQNVGQNFIGLQKWAGYSRNVGGRRGLSYAYRMIIFFFKFRCPQKKFLLHGRGCFNFTAYFFLIPSPYCPLFLKIIAPYERCVHQRKYNFFGVHSKLKF